MSHVWSAIAVVHLFGAALTILLWHMVRRLTDQAIANRAITLFWFFPAAAVLSMVYAEALLLVWIVASLSGLLYGRWLTAGVTAALASATRPNGVVMFVPCLWQAALAIRRQRDWRAMIAPSLAPLGFVLYLVFLWGRTGDPFVWWRVQEEGWGAS
jgi:Gpi18-like mannosyltransferase